MIENLNWIFSLISLTYWMIIFGFLLIPFYLFPTLIAWGFGREPKKNLRAILALNILLGWTFIGWVIALVWAFMKEPGEK